MTFMLCRNRVRDFDKWKAVFDSHEEDHRAAGLRLVNLWRGVEDVNEVFFLFEVADLHKAREFIGNAEASDAADTSGVIEGDYYFVDSASGY